MGAGINSILAHGVEPIHIDPFAAQAKALQIGEYYAKQNLQKQQTEEARLKNVDTQRGIDAEAALSQAIGQNTVQDPQTGKPIVDHDAVARQVAGAGFPARADAYNIQRRADEKAAIDNHKNQLEIVGKQNDMLASGFQAMANVPDESFADVHDQLRDRLMKEIGPEVADKIAPASFIMAKGGVNALKAYDANHAAQLLDQGKQITNQHADATYALDLNKYDLDVLKEKPITDEKWLNTSAPLFAAAKTDAQWAAARNHLVSANAPQSVIDLFPQQFTPDAVQAAERITQTPAERETGRHNLVEEAGQAANLAETKNYHEQEAANQNARIKLERSKEGREQQIYNQTYGAGANPALQGVEPKLRTAAASQAQKAATEYATATNAADEMKTIIDLARGGNKIAYAYAPTTGVLTINSGNGVKRVNMAEISQYGGAGSLLDRVQGYLGKQATGASIPKDILDDMEKLHDSLGGNAAKNYNDKLSAVNQNYRSNFQPVPMGSKSNAGGGTGALSTGHKVGDIVNTKSQGKVKITKVNPDDSFEYEKVK